MKLSAAQADKFIKNPDPSVRIILIYGPDTGQVSFLAEKLASWAVPDKNDPFAVSRFLGNEIKDERGRLFDEMATPPFGGGRRLVRLQRAIESNAEEVARVIAEMPAGNGLLLIEAGDLEKRSKLRVAAEAAANEVVAIACYVEEGAAKAKTIAALIQANSLTARPEVIRFLGDVLPPDRLAQQQEMDKLFLYVTDKKHIELDDVRAIISDAGAANLDELVQSTLLGHVAESQQILAHLYEEQTSPVAIFRALQRHLLRLQMALAHKQNGASAEAALKKLRPPVFWKQEKPMLAQLQRWSLEKCERRLAQLAEAEAAVKRTGAPDTTQCAQLVLSIAAKP
ncbi:MAG: DNA polymerase III subunit delta [Proteobacteria bacterium]|jgi:DNA polymerase-3 subunit delta|nr:DNA polymerase III subunit delta [Alphaproteobacteria bacterium]NCC03610.1 DNA polymerase III subunit delta [Pseudomonadota bacterium]